MSSGPVHSGSHPGVPPRYGLRVRRSILCAGEPQCGYADGLSARERILINADLYSPAPGPRPASPTADANPVSEYAEAAAGGGAARAYSRTTRIERRVPQDRGQEQVVDLEQRSDPICSEARDKSEGQRASLLWQTVSSAMVAHSSTACAEARIGLLAPQE
jgi:hypothetical protein